MAIPLLRELIASALGIRFGGDTAPFIRSGAGSPEGVVAAPVGSQWLRTDGGAGTAVYNKESGAGNTGWTADAGGGGAATVVAGRTYRSTNQSIPAGAGFTLVSFDTVGMAVGGTFYSSGAPTEAIIPEDGVYQVDFEGTGEGTAVIVTWEIQVSLVGGGVLGSTQFMAPASATAPLDNGSTRQYTAGQKITVGVKHSNATALNLLNEGNHSPDIRITKIGGAKGDLGGAVAGGATTQVQYNNAGAIAGASFATIDATGHIVASEYIEHIAPAATPATPIVNRARLFFKSIAGRLFLGILGNDGEYDTLQPHVGRNRVAQWQAIGNGNALTQVGSAALLATGIPTAANFAITNAQTRSRRAEVLVTTAATTAVAGFRYDRALWFRGNAVAQGGFTYIQSWGPATGVATATNRAFCGMAATIAAPTDVEPSTQVNCVGMGWNAADANIQIMHNAGSGGATKVNLGAGFPVPTVDRTKQYELTLYCPPNAAFINYTVEDIETGAIATGQLTTNLPVNTTALAPRVWTSVGGTSSVTGLSFSQCYIANAL